MTDFYPAVQKIVDPCRAFMYWILFFLIAIALANSFLIDKHFATDGVYYFRDLLQNRDFVHHDWARQYSLYLTQWPVVLALRMGVKDILILNRLFALSVFSVYLFSFSLCNYAVRGGDKSILIWPLLSMLAFNLSTDYHLTGEFPVVMLISWPVLFLILKENLNNADRILLLLLLIAFTRIYQSALTISLIFILLLLYQHFYHKRKRPMTELLILIFLCLAAFLIAFYTTLNPSSESNKDSFIIGLRLMFYNIPAIVSVFFIALFFISLILNKKWFYPVPLIPVMAYFVYILCVHHGIKIYISFAARSMSATFFPILLLLSLIFYFRKLQLSRFTILIPTLFTIVIITGNIKFSRDWREYREEFKKTLRQNIGFVQVEQTNLMNDMCYWDWTSPYLSLVWSDGCVRSIVVNVSSRRYFPENPYKRLLLKDYLTYDPYFFAIDSSAVVCNKK